MAGHEWREDIPEWGTDHTKDAEGRCPETWDLHAGISRLVTGAGQARLIRNLIPPMLGTDSGRGHSIRLGVVRLGGPGRGEESQGSSTLLRGPPTVLLVLLNQEP